MLEKLKAEVLDANKGLKRHQLVSSTWGNVSGRDAGSGFVAIKASGVEYDQMTLDDIVVVDLEGDIIEGNRRPSTDLDTHLQLYRSFEELVGWRIPIRPTPQSGRKAAAESPLMASDTRRLLSRQNSSHVYHDRCRDSGRI